QLHVNKARRPYIL
uniref:Neurotensin n=2 Tax=Neognathae TaxID=8825 RepID=NEUT_CHICK|nr:RecName: Full=Neurotensin; Short=NT [Gallus gallus]